MDTEFITGYTSYSLTRKYTHPFPCSSGSPAYSYSTAEEYCKTCSCMNLCFYA